MARIMEKKIEQKEIYKNEKVKLVPVVKQRANLEESHAASFLFEGCTNAYQARLFDAQQGKSVDPLEHLTREQKFQVEKDLGLEEGSLNHVKQDNYYMKRIVELDGREKEFDLNDPQQYVDYYIMMTYKGSDVCENYERRYSLPTYKYAILQHNQKERMSVSEMDTELTNASILASIIKNEDTMRNALLTYWFDHGKPAKNVAKMDETVLKSEVYAAIKTDGVNFRSTVQDKLYEEKLLLAKGSQKGIIKYQRGSFYYMNETSPFATSIIEATEFLAKPGNAAMAEALKKQLNK